MTREEELENQIEKMNALNKILIDTDRTQGQMLRHFKNMIITAIICLSLIICCMVIGFFWYDNQFETVEADGITKTTTMTTSGDNANINNITDGDQYNDNAIHNEENGR